MAQKKSFSIPWFLYFLIIAVIYVIALVSAFVGYVQVPDLIDLAIMLPAIIALLLYTSGVESGGALAWKIYAVVFPLYGIVSNVFIQPFISNTPLSVEDLIGGAIILPLYVGVILFAFRWS